MAYSMMALAAIITTHHIASHVISEAQIAAPLCSREANDAP